MAESAENATPWKESEIKPMRVRRRASERKELEVRRF